MSAAIRRPGRHAVVLYQLLDLEVDGLLDFRAGLNAGQVAGVAVDPADAAVLLAVVDRLLAGDPLVGGPDDPYWAVTDRLASAEAHRLLAGVSTVDELLARIDGRTTAPDLVAAPAARVAAFAGRGLLPAYRTSPPALPPALCEPRFPRRLRLRSRWPSCRHPVRRVLSWVRGSKS